MNTSELIKELCKYKNISLSELARRIGQSPQNFNKKLKRETISYDELLEIAEAMEAKFEQEFKFADGCKLIIGSDLSSVSYQENKK